MKNKNYTICDSERETARWKVNVEMDEVKFEMHLKEDLTIDKPFGPVCTLEFSKTIEKIVKEFKKEIK